MSGKVRVFEPPSLQRRLTNAILSIPVSLSIIFGWLIFIVNGPVLRGEMSWTMSFVIFMLMILGEVLLGPLLLVVGRRGIMVTPILFISEEKPTAIDQMYWWYGLFGYLLLKLLQRNKFILCEEGAVVYEFGGPILYRWNKIRSFTVDNNNQQFILQVSMFRKVILSTSVKYEQVYRILSEHIPATS